MGEAVTEAVVVPALEEAAAGAATARTSTVGTRRTGDDLLRPGSREIPGASEIRGESRAVIRGESEVSAGREGAQIAGASLGEKIRGP